MLKHLPQLTLAVIFCGFVSSCATPTTPGDSKESRSLYYKGIDYDPDVLGQEFLDGGSG